MSQIIKFSDPSPPPQKNLLRNYLWMAPKQDEAFALTGKREFRVGLILILTCLDKPVDEFHILFLSDKLALV